jgi:hypothetical protein
LKKAVRKLLEYEHMDAAADAKGKLLAELEDELKIRDRRIAELREEIDDLRQSRQRLIESCASLQATTEQRCETFDMELTADNCWTWKPFWKGHWKLVEDFNALVRDWNRCIATADPGRNVGRPLAASASQVREVLRLRRGSGDDSHITLDCPDEVLMIMKDEAPPAAESMSLRRIAEETSLSLATVRTIIGQANRTDRTTRKHLARITIDKAQIATWKRQRRTGDALPKRINTALAEGRKAVKEAKA